MGGSLSIQWCVERVALEEQEDPDKPRDPSKASVVTIATPWHGRPLPPPPPPPPPPPLPPPPRIVTTNLLRTISNATTLPS